MRILIYGAGVIGGKSMKNEEYKKLSIDEFTKAAGRYESNHAGIYEMCKKDYPDILAELEKEPFRGRAIQERRYRPVGAKEDKTANVRIVAATNGERPFC